jgi:hypothetical protein
LGSATIVFPDVAAVLLSYLAPRLGVATGSVVPNPRPSTFLLARRVGGERTSPVHERALLLFEAWAHDPGAADDLANQVRGELFALGAPGTWSGGSTVSGVSIVRVEDAGGPAYQPDELSDQPRATFTLSVLVRGQLQEDINGS